MVFSAGNMGNTNHRSEDSELSQDLNHGDGHTFYDLMFQGINAKGLPIPAAAISVAEAYLDGKPAKRGKVNISQTERDELFWKSEFLFAVPASTYLSEPFVLALARYLRQERIANFKLLQQVATQAPEAVRRAVRYSDLVLRKTSQRWSEIEQLVTVAKPEFDDFIRVCDALNRAYGQREAAVETHRKPLEALTPLELLSYASLYAFEHLVPGMQSPGDHEACTDTDWESASEAINDILLWKLKTANDEAFHLTDVIIAASLRDHLVPFLFPSPTGSLIREDIYRAFKLLTAVQMEMNSFLYQSVDAFCYNDSINFEFEKARLAIVERDSDARGTWQRNGDKLARLHTYLLVLSGFGFICRNRTGDSPAWTPRKPRNESARLHKGYSDRVTACRGVRPR